MIGRYGGEEFLIALSDVSPEKAAIVIERIREDFSSLPHAHPNGTLFATFSAGIASYPNFRSAVSLTEAADNAFNLRHKECKLLLIFFTKRLQKYQRHLLGEFKLPSTR